MSCNHQDFQNPGFRLNDESGIGVFKGGNINW